MHRGALNVVGSQLKDSTNNNEKSQIRIRGPQHEIQVNPGQQHQSIVRSHGQLTIPKFEDLGSSIVGHGYFAVH